MVTEITEIKEIRKKLNLTQHDLAKHAGVSQSLIAKVEAGRLDPTYTNAVKIFTALDSLSKKQDVKAEEMMNEKIISILPNMKIEEAILAMKKYGFSQLPVIHDHKAVGMISEGSILNALINKKGKTIEDIMESPPPIVSFDSSMQIIANLLKYFQMVLVSKKGKLIGVITKTDLLAKMYNK
jgi:predicted transcriptional regulator